MLLSRQHDDGEDPFCGEEHLEKEPLSGRRVFAQSNLNCK